jgi:hypothetical protein
MKSLLEDITTLYAGKIKRLEHEIGYQLILPRMPDDWINGYVPVDLTNAWKKFGLDVTGYELWTVGAIKNGISTRFDPNAKQYQSWVGGYVVKFADTKEWTLQDHLSLAVVDQRDWLHDYGDPAPVAEFHPSGFQAAGDISISGYSGKLYVGGGVTHSDIGPGNHHIRAHTFAHLVADLFNLSNPTLQVKGENFIPTEPVVDPYETVYVKCCIAILEIEKNLKAVLYGSGTIQIDETTGKEIDTFETLKGELLAIVRGMRIVPV